MLHHYRLHWQMHPEKDERWYLSQCKRMTPNEIARELDISYELSVNSRVFNCFNERKHVRYESYRVNPHQPVYRIWDFGRTNVILYGQIDDQARRHVFNERLLTESNTMQQVRICQEDCAKWFSAEQQFIDICDPAGNYDDGRGKDTHVEILNQSQLFPQFDKIIAIPTIQRKKRAIVMIESDLQSCPAGDDAIQLHVSSDRKQGPATLLKAFQSGYCFKLDAHKNVTDVIDEQHPYEDVMDCLMYWYLQTKHYRPENKAQFKYYR